MSRLEGEVAVLEDSADREAQRRTSRSKTALPKLSRDSRVDSFRGLMLAEIALVHLHCPIGKMCDEFFGRVSAAAGFVFLSGILAGAVYSRTTEQGASAIFKRCARRSLYIHTYHVVAFLGLLCLALLVPRAEALFRFAISESDGGVLHALALFVVWAYQPRLFDILPMYGLFVFCMPAALLALRSNRGLAMLAVSLGIWALAQMGLGYVEDGASPFGLFRGGFNPLAWQFVFFSGLYFGHMHLYRGNRVVEARPMLLGLCMLICVIGFTMRWELLPWPALFGTDGWIASKREYGPAFLINFLAFAYLVYALAARFPRAFNWPALAFLGKHSIQVFTFHVVVIYLASPFIPRAAALGPWVYNGLGALIVASLFVPAWCHSKWPAAVTALRGYQDRAKNSGAA